MERAARVLWKRILSGVVLAPLVVFLVYWHPSLYIALVCVAAVLLSFEYYQLAEKLERSSKSKGQPARSIKFIGSGLTLLTCLSATDKINTDFIISLAILLAIIIQIVRRDFSTAFLTITSIIFGTMYIGWAFGVHLIRLRQLSMDNAPDRVGVYLIFFLLAVIWMGDTGAYAFGKLLGKHKLIPSISPGKTVEGSIGGLLAGTIGGIAVKIFLLDGVLGWTHTIIFAIILGIVGQIGDLGESLLKRNAGVKDSGNLIPGHGGLFDRCDSLVLTAPVLYYLLKLSV